MCILAAVTAGCNKNNDEYLCFIGKWKLEKITIPFYFNSTYDYSQYNIVYDFKPKNVLTISGETDTMVYRGHRLGNSFYKIYGVNDKIKDKDFYHSHYYNHRPILKINNMYQTYRISDTNLEIDDSWADGSIYYLVKIN